MANIVPNEVDYLIVGGGVAGTTAAETIRRHNASATIAIVSDEPYRFYSRIMLSKPNFFLGRIPFDAVWLKTEAWYVDQKITFIGGRTAVRLDATAKVVTLDGGSSIRYGKLLLAVGGAARKWSVPGADKIGVHYLRTLDHAKAVMDAVKTAKRAIVIGSGFVSFEMCDMLRVAGLDVTEIMLEPYYWYPVLDEVSGRMVEGALTRGGVRIIRQAEVVEVLGGTNVEGVVLKDGARIPCGLAMVGIGLCCMYDWAKSGGVAVGRGIFANEYLETNLPDVWTAGDAAEFQDIVLHERIMMGNWANAQMQGKTAAMNMLGQRELFRLVSFYTAQGFGMNVAFIGDVRMLSGREVMIRGSLEAGAFVRCITTDGRVVGATLINRTQDLGTIAQWIDRGVDIRPFAERFADLQTNIKTLAH